MLSHFSTNPMLQSVFEIQSPQIFFQGVHLPPFYGLMLLAKIPLNALLTNSSAIGLSLLISGSSNQQKVHNVILSGKNFRSCRIMSIESHIVINRLVGHFLKSFRKAAPFFHDSRQNLEFQLLHTWPFHQGCRYGLKVSHLWWLSEYIRFATLVT